MNAIHIRRPFARQTRNQSYGAYRRTKNEQFRADFRPELAGTYCGAPETSLDWGRREAVAKRYAAQAEKECCRACLEAARKAAAS